MPKAKGKTRRQKFGYNVNRKRLNRNARRKAAPRIECSHIRHAWDHAKSVRQNLAEMGLAMDPNKAVPFRKRKVKGMEVDTEARPKELVRKPYVLNGRETDRWQESFLLLVNSSNAHTSQDRATLKPGTWNSS